MRGATMLKKKWWTTCSLFLQVGFRKLVIDTVVLSKRGKNFINDVSNIILHYLYSSGTSWKQRSLAFRKIEGRESTFTGIYCWFWKNTRLVANLKYDVKYIHFANIACFASIYESQDCYRVWSKPSLPIRAAWLIQFATHAKNMTFWDLGHEKIPMMQHKQFKKHKRMFWWRPHGSFKWDWKRNNVVFCFNTWLDVKTLWKTREKSG